VKAAPAVASSKAGAPGAVDKTLATKTPRQRAEADYQRAVALVNGARVSEAIDLLLDILQQDGGHVASRQMLARLLIEQRRNDEAMAILAEGLASQPAQVSWAMTLARLQVERGDLAGAARTLQQSQPFATGNADYQGFAGHVQHRLGHGKESIDFYQAATRLAPADGRWWLGLGLSLEADHRPAEAREAFLRARASGSLNPDLVALVDQKLR
jgi:MSHA biogenesis protein MshN